MPLPKKIEQQIAKAGLPLTGAIPFEPQVTTNRRGDPVIEKAEVLYGPKRGKRGYVDTHGRIWIRDRGHTGAPDHWDVQIGRGIDYVKVDDEGNQLE